MARNTSTLNYSGKMKYAMLMEVCVGGERFSGEPAMKMALPWIQAQLYNLIDFNGHG